jgi:hypothetical protein
LAQHFGVLSEQPYYACTDRAEPNKTYLDFHARFSGALAAARTRSAPS